MSHSGTCWVLLSPGAIEVARASRGSVVAWSRRALDPTEWPKHWSERLTSLDEPLRAAMVETGVAPGSAVRILYYGADTQAEVVSVPSSVPKTVDAARLAFANAAAGGLDGRVHALRVLHRDPAGPSARTHVLAIADTDACAQAVGDWIERGGGTLGALTPALACQLVEGVGVATTNRGAPTYLVHLGEHDTVVCVNDGDLRCVRTLGFGFGALVGAIDRTARSLGAGAPAREVLRTIFLRDGLKLQAATTELLGVSEQDLMPALQPILQRYVVETKQTLRFLIGDRELARTTLTLSGPGSGIPGLAELVSHQLECDVKRSDATGDGLGDRRSSELTRAIAAGADAPTFVPTRETHRFARRRFRMALVAGASVAAGLIGIDALGTWQQISRERAGLADVSPRLADLRSLIERRELVHTLQRRVSDLDRSVLNIAGSRVMAGAFLRELAGAIDPSVRVTEISINATPAGCQANVRAFVSLPKGAEETQSASTTALSPFLQRLRTSAMVDSVEIGATRLGAVGDAPVTHFTVTIRPVTAPPTALADAEEE